mmetsp:Transcript_14865/g.51060  ORF Transcript_14865/g.51060 Transcript_14865/m.51060 type:complete len:204 (-) Transcript_14865:401-1012(-)
MEGQYLGPRASTHPPYVGVSERLSRMIWCVASVVRVRWQGTCARGTCTSGSKLNQRSCASPGCCSHRKKSTVRASTRAGVPVLRRSVSNPSATRLSVRPLEGASPARPASMLCLPTHMRPFMNVPVVSTVAAARISTPQKVRTPSHAPPLPTSTSTACPSRMCRFGVDSSTRRITRAYSRLSVCARSAHTAGPLVAFSTRRCR